MGSHVGEMVVTATGKREEKRQGGGERKNAEGEERTFRSHHRIKPTCCSSKKRALWGISVRVTAEKPICA